VFEEKSMPVSQWKGWSVQKADSAAMPGPKHTAGSGTKVAPNSSSQAVGGKSQTTPRHFQMSTRDAFRQANGAVNALRNFLNRTAAELDIDLKQVVASGSAPQAARNPAGGTAGASSGSARIPAARASKPSGGTSDAELAHLREETKILKEKLKTTEHKLLTTKAKLERYERENKGIASQKPPSGQ